MNSIVLGVNMYLANKTMNFITFGSQANQDSQNIICAENQLRLHVRRINFSPVSTVANTLTVQCWTYHLDLGSVAFLHNFTHFTCDITVRCVGSSAVKSC